MISKRSATRVPIIANPRGESPERKGSHYTSLNFREITAEPQVSLTPDKTGSSSETVEVESAAISMNSDSASEERFRRLVEIAPDTVLLHADGELIFINPAGVRLLGAETSDQLIGQPIERFVEGQVLAAFSETDVLPSGAGAEVIESQLRRLDGEMVDVELVGLPSSFEGRSAAQLVVRDVSRRKRAEAALRESEERYRSLFEDVPVGVYRISLSGEIVHCNRAVVELLGYPNRKRLLGTDSGELYSEKEDLEAWKTMMQFEGRVVNFEVRIRRFDGSRVWARSHATAIREGGKVVGYRGTVEDITDRKLAEDALRTSEERFRSLVQNASDMISILDSEAKIVYASPSSQRILGTQPTDSLGDHGFDLIHPKDRPRVQSMFDDLLSKPGKSSTAEYRIRHTEGAWRVLESSMTNLLHNPAVSGVVVNSRDVSDRKRAEDRLLHDALHDALTGLPNRTLFMDRLAHCLDRRSRLATYRCAVLFLDLDRFKMINDSLGHAAGDRLLTHVSARLKACLRPSDTLARLGGDEFAILLDDVKDASNAVRVAQRIQAELEVPFSLDGREIYSTASIGIAISDRHSGPEDVLRDADTAMYRAKGQGRAGHAIFDAEMHAEVRSQLQLETDLRRALARGQFEVFYQPIVALTSGAIAGFEALARWHHPERGLLLPGEFMPLAEETGLVNAIGRTLMRDACRQMKAWNDRRSSLEPLFVCVNLSRRQIQQPDLLDQIAEVLGATGLPGDRLSIEVAETGVADRPDSVLETLVRLRRIGVRISLDNFGTGTASLSLLHRFPFDRVKLDRWFIHGIGSDGPNEELVEGILTLCHSQRLDTVAEGVETPDQCRRLAELGCDFAQGFLFSEPMSRQGAEELLTAATLSFDPSDVGPERPRRV